MLNLVPYPSGRVQELSGTFTIPNALGVELGDFADWCLEDFIQRTGLALCGERWMKLVRNGDIPELLMAMIRHGKGGQHG